jgi:hypothetical protein
MQTAGLSKLKLFQSLLRVWRARLSPEFLTRGRLAETKKSLHELPFATNSHAAESFEPSAVWNLRLGVKPVRKFAKLRRWDVSFSDAVEKVIEQSRR